MLKTVEAIIHKDGTIHLMEKIDMKTEQRVLITFLDEAPDHDGEQIDTALLSEGALCEDWDKAEEDAAWEHLQEEK